MYVLNVAKGEGDKYANLINDEAVTGLIAESDGQVFNIGFCYVPDKVTLVDGIPDEMTTAIVDAQLLADWHKPIVRKTDCPSLSLPLRKSTMSFPPVHQMERLIAV